MRGRGGEKDRGEISGKIRQKHKSTFLESGTLSVYR